MPDEELVPTVEELAGVWAPEDDEPYAGPEEPDRDGDETADSAARRLAREVIALQGELERERVMHQQARSISDVYQRMARRAQMSALKMAGAFLATVVVMILIDRARRAARAQQTATPGVAPEAVLPPPPAASPIAPGVAEPPAGAE